MFFLDEKGTIQEGTPLTDVEKETLDRIVDLLHNCPDICGGFHPSYNVKCVKMAMEIRSRFDIALKPDFEFKEVEEPAVEEAPEIMPEYPSPEHVQEPMPPAAMITESDYPF